MTAQSPLPALVQDADRTLDAKLRDLLWPWDESRCRVCGWPLKDRVEYGCVPGNCSERPPRDWRADEPPKFSSDWSAIRLVEDEIERRGLGEDYVIELRRLVPSPRYPGFSIADITNAGHRRETFALLRASCEDRCKAALSVCGALHDRRTDA